MLVCNRFDCVDEVCKYHYTNIDEPGYFQFADLSSQGCFTSIKRVFSPDNAEKVELPEKISKFREGHR